VARVICNEREPPLLGGPVALAYLVARQSPPATGLTNSGGFVFDQGQRIGAIKMSWQESLISRIRVLAGQEKVLVHRSFIRITGDLVSGVLLSQIYYWCFPYQDENGVWKSRLRVRIKDGDGHIQRWLAKSDKDWEEEIGVTEKQAERARSLLEAKNLIITTRKRFGGKTVMHIRLNLPVLEEKLGSEQRLMADERLKNMSELGVWQETFPELREPGIMVSPPERSCQLRPSGVVSPPERSSITETTTETTETTPPPATPDDEIVYPVKEERWVNTGQVGVQDTAGNRWVTTKEELHSDSPSPQWKPIEEPVYVDLDEDGFPLKEKHPIVKHIESRGRVLTASQQQKMMSGVPKHNPKYPSPAQLFMDDPLFEVYVDDKVSWADGSAGDGRKQTLSLVGAIRNYETEKFGWIDFKQRHAEKRGETTTSPP